MKTGMGVFNDFYFKQWELLSNFKKKLNEELQRYAEQPRGIRRKDFIFQLGMPVSLEELPILFLNMQKKPNYRSRFSWYEVKDKEKSLKEIENFLRLIGIEPNPRPPELEKIIQKWEKE